MEVLATPNKVTKDLGAITTASTRMTTTTKRSMPVSKPSVGAEVVARKTNRGKVRRAVVAIQTSMRSWTDHAIIIGPQTSKTLQPTTTTGSAGCIARPPSRPEETMTTGKICTTTVRTLAQAMQVGIVPAKGCGSNSLFRSKT